MKTRFLNAKVEAAVKADPTLFLAWWLVGPQYDDEIDPLHNPTWVAAHEKHEEQTLESICETIKVSEQERVKKQ